MCSNVNHFALTNVENKFCVASKLLNNFVEQKLIPWLYEAKTSNICFVYFLSCLVCVSISLVLGFVPYWLITINVFEIRKHSEKMVKTAPWEKIWFFILDTSFWRHVAESVNKTHGSKNLVNYSWYSIGQPYI